jgi:hypothetical protein
MSSVRGAESATRAALLVLVLLGGDELGLRAMATSVAVTAVEAFATTGALVAVDSAAIGCSGAIAPELPGTPLA